jgi:hypothetical protein
MDKLAALAPAAPLHRLHGVKGPAATALNFIRHSHYTVGGREFWGAVIVIAVLLVAWKLGRASRRRAQRTP